MADCECLPKCPFFNDKMSAMPSMADIYKERDCQGDNSQCARYKVFLQLGRDRVPGDLYPNQFERVYAIIDEAG